MHITTFFFFFFPIEGFKLFKLLVDISKLHYHFNGPFVKGFQYHSQTEVILKCLLRDKTEV